MIPHGLMTCYLDTESQQALEVRVLDLSVLGFSFRLPKGESPIGNKVRITVHQLYMNENRTFNITDAVITVESCERYWTVYHLETGSSEFRRIISAFMREYNSYVQMKLCGDTDSIESAMCRAEARDDTYCADIHAQRDKWCSRLRLPSRWHEAKEIAVILDNPEIISAYLDSPAAAFFTDYKKIRGCGAACLGALELNCLYIGNEYCIHLLPEADTLSAVLEKACSEHLYTVLCLPPIPDQAVERTVSMIRQTLETFPVREIVVNDWGTLSVLSGLKNQSLAITLGVLLCKRHKDTRFDRLNGSCTVPAQASVDDPVFRSQLVNRFGKLHFSCEAGFGTAPISGADVMYWPTAQLNTAEYCGLRSVIEAGNRALQKYESDCPRYCSNHFLFYPEHLDMLGKYNTVFGFSDCEEPSAFERLVITLP